LREIQVLGWRVYFVLNWGAVSESGVEEIFSQKEVVGKGVLALVDLV
jgi:hypothetical protein